MPCEFLEMFFVLISAVVTWAYTGEYTPKNYQAVHLRYMHLLYMSYLNLKKKIIKPQECRKIFASWIDSPSSFKYQSAFSWFQLTGGSRTTRQGIWWGRKRSPKWKEGYQSYQLKSLLWTKTSQFLAWEMKKRIEMCHERKRQCWMWQSWGELQELSNPCSTSESRCS